MPTKRVQHHAPNRAYERCGEGFYAEPYVIRRGGGRFCSRSCRTAAINLERGMSGEANPNWKGGVSADDARYRRRTWLRYPEKNRARWIFEAAIRSGRIERGPCEVCGTTKNVEGHHDDYARPLVVRWLCRKHHLALHNSRGDMGNHKRLRRTA